MDLKGGVEIPSSPNLVWTALHDPAIWSSCVPECDKFERVHPCSYAAHAFIKMGPVRSRIAVTIRLSEGEPPKRVGLNLIASGKIGTAETNAQIELHPIAGGTRLIYVSQTTFKGQAAKLAKRYAGAAAEQLVREFFLRFAAAVPNEPETGTQEDVSAFEPHPPAAAPMMAPSSLSRQRLHFWIGIAAGTGAIVTTAAAILLTRHRRR